MADNENNETEGEGLVSQDDIDKLFESPSGEPEGGAQSETAPEEVAGPSGGGHVDQSDTDSLLADAGAAQNTSQGQPAAAAASTTDSSGTFDQSDIDALLNAADADPSAAPGDSTTPPADARVDAYGKPFDEAAAAMAAAIEEEKAAAQAAQTTQPAQSVPTTSTFEMPELSGTSADSEPAGKLDMLMDVTLHVKIELGRTHMFVEDVLKLGEGSVVELDKLAGDPVDVYVNERLVARGEVLVLNDNFCVRVSEVLTRDPHRIGSG